MKNLKKLLLIVAIALLPILFTVACTVNESEKGANKIVPYGSARINYHYEYNVFIETYYVETFPMIEIGKVHYVENLWTPPTDTGYRFIGWAMSARSGTLVSTPFEVVGGAAAYNLYAQFEPIEYEVVYHLDGGTNNPGNPSILTGKKALLNPTKEGFDFVRWYLDSELEVPTNTLQMHNNEETTVHLYAAWAEVFSITYVSDIPSIKVDGDLTKTRYRDDSEAFFINLKNEYFVNYMFFGWTYEGQDTPKVGDSSSSYYATIQLEIPKGTKGDLTFTAHYRAVTTAVNTPGVSVVHNQGVREITVPAGVTEVVIPDILSVKWNGYDYLTAALIKYVDDTPPTVIAREDIRIEFQKI